MNLHSKLRSKELHRRSIIKSISYRLVSIAADSIAAYFFTRSVAETAGIVVLLNTYSTFLYYFHERIWSHIHWGRRKNEDE
jgi:uncharacterized membrane protein